MFLLYACFAAQKRDTTSKHAFLILAHEKPELVQLLIAQLDDPRNDIYLHIDAKVSVDNTWQFDTKYAELIVLPNRIKGSWGTYSLVEIELRLFEAAMSRMAYRWYHLLSGQDLCLQSQDSIHKFFDANQHTQFLDKRDKTQFMGSPVSGTFKDRKIPLTTRLGKAVYGQQWASLTDKAVFYLLKSRAMIREVFSETQIPDEHYKQMTLINSGKFNIAGYNKRYIRWTNSGQKGHPDYLTKEYVANAFLQDFFFGRKFSLSSPEWQEGVRTALRFSGLDDWLVDAVAAGWRGGPAPNRPRLDEIAQ